jgi:hypothetical protein
VFNSQETGGNTFDREEVEFVSKIKLADSKAEPDQERAQDLETLELEAFIKECQAQIERVGGYPKATKTSSQRPFRLKSAKYSLGIFPAD